MGYRYSVRVGAMVAASLALTAAAATQAESNGGGHKTQISDLADQHVHLHLSMVTISPASSPVSDAGATGVLEVSIDVPDGTEVDAAQNTLAWSSDDISVSGCKVNEQVDKPFFMRHRPSGCIEGIDCSELDAFVIGGQINPFDDGVVLYTCNVGLSAGSASALLSGETTWTIRCFQPFSSSSDGEPLATTCNDTTVVLQSTPTHSPTQSPTVAPTATHPTPTKTAAPTATRSTPTETAVAETPTPVPTATATPRPRFDDDGCQIGAPGERYLSWIVILAVPAIILRRRRS